MKTAKNVRVIIRHWMPRKTQPIPIDTVRTFIQTEYNKLQNVLYVGWARIQVNGKRSVQLIAATGKSSLEARKNFKTRNTIGTNVWILI